MKRAASDAFGGDAAAGAPAAKAFQPTGQAMLDPKAYFAQYQQQVASAAAAAPPVPGAAAAAEKSEVHRQVEEASSAVKCSNIVKEKGANFTNVVAIEALCTMATKSSFKLREELAKQPHNKKLCMRVQGICKAPPAGLPVETLARAVWSLTRFPDDARGDPAVTFGATAKALGAAKPSSWNANSASKVLWSLARCDVVGQHKPLVSQVVAELVKEKGKRAAELSHEGLTNLLWAIGRARRHIKQGEHQMVHAEANDELLFSMAAHRVEEEIEQIDAKLLAEIIHTHNEIGIRNEKLFKVACPLICKKQKELDEQTMGRVIKAYRRFMIPLKEEAQGFRTMAVVSKGDFIRPSEKPKRTTKRTFDHPVQLYDKTQKFN